MKIQLLFVAVVLSVVACGTTAPLAEAPTAPPTTPPEPAAPRARTLKLLFVFDAAQSSAVTDAAGVRVGAMLSLLDQLPSDSEVMVTMFAGTTVAYLTPTAAPLFTPVSELTAADRQLLTSRILNFSGAGASRDSTDFVAPLSAVKTAIAADLHEGGSATYQVVFVSDGAPTTDQDQELLCGTAVTGIRALSNDTTDVHVSTVLAFGAALPECSQRFTEERCSIHAGPGACSAAVVDANEARLRGMARLGDGTFLSFRTGAPFTYAPVVAR